jgi:excisionase family DNA binding protein
MSKSRSRSAQPALLTVSQVAAHLAVDPSTVRRWIEDGRLPAVKPGGQWRIHPDELHQLLRVSTPLVRS